MPELKKDPETGIYQVGFMTEHGKKWRSTGMRVKGAAQAIVDSSGLARLEMAAQAGTLTAEAIAAITTGKRTTCQRAFELWKEQRSYEVKESTLETQENIIKQFFEHQKCADMVIAKVGKLMVRAFVNDPKYASKQTRLGRKAALSSFFRFLQASALNVGNPAELTVVNHQKLSWEENERIVRIPFTRAEYDTIMNEFKGWEKWATALSYWTGMRLSDVACLEWASIKGDAIIVHTRKRGTRVALPLADPLIGSGELTQTLCDIFEAKSDPTYCFPEQRQTYLNHNTSSKLSAYYVRNLTYIGIPNRSFHCLRHSFITRLKNAGKTMEQIGVLVGHANPETTLIYSH